MFSLTFLRKLSSPVRSVLPPAHFEDLMGRCEEKWYDQVIDHFGFDLATTYKQR